MGRGQRLYPSKRGMGDGEDIASARVRRRVGVSSGNKANER